MPVVPWIKKHGLFDAACWPPTACTSTRARSARCENAGAGVAHNPSSNLKLGAGIAPVARMLELGLDVGIGTDGAASNNDLDMFEEMRLAALVAKGAGGDPTAVPARDRAGHGHATRRLRRSTWITSPVRSNPASAPTSSSLDLERLHSTRASPATPTPMYAQIVYAAKSTDVVDVMCNGRWLMRDRGC
jgi:5-methylthioadenosine/S-adenosylhomocysteine deaminase